MYALYSFLQYPVVSQGSRFFCYRNFLNIHKISCSNAYHRGLQGYCAIPCYHVQFVEFCAMFWDHVRRSEILSNVPWCVLLCTHSSFEMFTGFIITFFLIPFPDAIQDLLYSYMYSTKYNYIYGNYTSTIIYSGLLWVKLWKFKLNLFYKKIISQLLGMLGLVTGTTSWSII